MLIFVSSLQILIYLVIPATVIGRYYYYLRFTVEEIDTKCLSNFELVELAFKFRQPGSRLCTCNDCISLIITEMQVSTAVILLVTCNIGINENTSTSSWEKWALTLCGKILWYHLFGGQFEQCIAWSKMYKPFDLEILC